MADVYDEMISEYDQQRKKTQEDISNLAIEKQNVLDTYEKNYQNQLTNYNDLMQQQQQNIDTWTETQRQTQQKQTDYNIGLINQNKEETQKQTNAEIGNAYIDYQKGLNQFGGSAETLASQGLGGTGFAKNQDIAMNITYQNRVASAKSALQKANTEYDNQIQQALLNNDAALAEVALQQMQQQYQLALKGFEYTSTMQNNRLSYIQNINDSYFSKTNTLQSRYDNYVDKINSAKSAREQAKLDQQTLALKYAKNGDNNSLKGFDGDGDKEIEVSTSNPYTAVGSAVAGILKANGTQQLKINGQNASRYTTIGNLFGKGKVNSGKLDNEYVYKAGNKYYIYSNGEYTDVTNLVSQIIAKQPSKFAA